MTKRFDSARRKYRWLAGIGIVGLALVGIGPTAAMASSPAAPPFVSITAGWFHTCALTAAGQVYCWGGNLDGQLGNGTFRPSSRPLLVKGLGGRAATVDAGFTNTCATMTSGSVKCWGADNLGILGDGDGPAGTHPGRRSALPVQVLGLTKGWTQVSVGMDNACAVSTSGVAKCWGANDDGQLGSGSKANQADAPVMVAAMGAPVRQLEAGDGSSCAVTVRGSAYCWGQNYFGTLGTGRYANSLVPRQVLGLTAGVRSISTGGGTSCAILAAGQVKCWGNGVDGRLGNGNVRTIPHPVAVRTLTWGARGLSAGGQPVCAIRANTSLACWGQGWSGALGDGSGSNSSVPASVAYLTAGVTALAAGQSHSCALTSGTAWCWGNNFDGQIGIGHTGGLFLRPVKVTF